jgi:hypothetical protein
MFYIFIPKNIFEFKYQRCFDKFLEFIQIPTNLRRFELFELIQIKYQGKRLKVTMQMGCL